MKILEFELNPTMKNYQLKAFELGIIEANEDTIKPWIFNRYINQLYMIKDRRFTYTNYDRWHATEGVTECQKLCVKSEMLSAREGMDIINFIHEMLDTDHYVFGRYNEFCVPQKNAYQKRYYVHDFIIYGYDEAKQIYYSAGYLADGKYKPFTITFADFCDALKTVTTEKLNFHFIKYKNGIDNRIDIRMIYEDLYDYLHSINRRNIVNKDKIFGIDCEYVFIDYLERINSSEAPCSADMRHSKFFAEMKMLMYERLKYLEENSYIVTGIADLYNCVRKKAELICMLSLKYNVTKDKNILQKVINYQTAIIDEEREILTCVLHQLRNVVGI